MHRLHRAWAVCLGGALALLATMGLGVNVFTIYQPYILELNHFANVQGSWITTTRSLFILIALMTVNQLCAKIGLRRVMTLGVCLVGAGCLLFGAARSFPTYCLAAAITGVGYCYGGMVPLSLTISHWFQDRRSFALGLAAAGSGVSTLFAPICITTITERWGMCWSFWAEGALILVLGALVWLLVRDRPEEVGLSPYRRENSAAPEKVLRHPARELSRPLWAALLFSSLLIGGPGGPGFSHLTVLYTSSGYSETAVAAYISYLGVAICIGKIICGQVYDRLGGFKGNIYAVGVFLAGFWLCCLAPLRDPFLPYLAVTGVGLGLCVTAVSFAQWASDLHGLGYEEAVRSLNVSYTLGMLVFGPIPGALADRFGSYVPAYILFIVLQVAALTLVEFIYIKQDAV